MGKLKCRFEKMTREQLETFATDMASYTCSHMTLAELKSWDSTLKSSAPVLVLAVDEKAKGG